MDFYKCLTLGFFLLAGVFLAVLAINYYREKSYKMTPGEFTGNEFIKENYMKCVCKIGPWTPISGICSNCHRSLFGEKEDVPENTLHVHAGSIVDNLREMDGYILVALKKELKNFDSRYQKWIK